VIGSSSPDVTSNEGLGDYRIAIPTHYLAMGFDDYWDHGDPWLTSEGVSGFTGDHCGASVLESAPGSLSNGFYECCAKSTFAEIMAEANAFAGLCFATTVLALALALLPIEYMVFHSMAWKEAKEHAVEYAMGAHDGASEIQDAL